jgi:hypothetical protein
MKLSLMENLPQSTSSRGGPRASSAVRRRQRDGSFLRLAGEVEEESSNVATHKPYARGEFWRKLWNVVF